MEKLTKMEQMRKLALRAAYDARGQTEKMDRAKQNKLIGTPGQVVGFGADGAAVATSGWSNPNLLDNWYFPDPVNQRGLSEYPASGYTIDRWKAPTNDLNVSLSDGLQLRFGDNPLKYSSILQHVEDYQFFAGKMVTVSALIKNPDGNNVQMTVKPTTGSGAGPWYSKTPPTSTDWILISGTGPFPKEPVAMTFLMYIMDPKPRTTVSVKAIKLELGDQQTLAHQDTAGNWMLSDPPPNKAVELAKCQRYQVVSDWGKFFTVGVGFTTSTTSANIFIPVPVTMRATPEISQTDGANWGIMCNGQRIVPASISKWAVGSNCILVRAQGEFPAANMPVVMNSNSGQKVIFDANL